MIQRIYAAICELVGIYIGHVNEWEYGVSVSEHEALMKNEISKYMPICALPVVWTELQLNPDVEENATVVEQATRSEIN